MRTYEIELVELPRQITAVVRAHVSSAGLPEFLGSAFGEVMQVLAAQGLSPNGPALGRYTPTGDGFDVEAGFPTTEAVTPSGRVQPGELPGGPAARVLHRGDYAGIAEAYDAAATWLDTEGCAATGQMWESYLDGPDVPEPRTLVYLPYTRL